MQKKKYNICVETLEQLKGLNRLLYKINLHLTRKLARLQTAQKGFLQAKERAI